MTEDFESLEERAKRSYEYQRVYRSGKSQKAYKRKHSLHTNGGDVSGLNKRDRPEACEICFRSNTKLDYHHWNNENLNMGVWVCWRCHHIICEAEDHRDHNTTLGCFLRYSKLKTLIESFSLEDVPSYNRFERLSTLEERAKRRYEYSVKHKMTISGHVNITTTGKRGKPGTCEICLGAGVHLVYHHWDANNPNKGVWVCHNCHYLVCEAEDCRGRCLDLIRRYLELKRSIESHDKTV